MVVGDDLNLLFFFAADVSYQNARANLREGSKGRKGLDWTDFLLCSTCGVGPIVASVPLPLSLFVNLAPLLALFFCFVLFFFEAPLFTLL